MEAIRVIAVPPNDADNVVIVEFDEISRVAATTSNLCTPAVETVWFVMVIVPVSLAGTLE
ncbi:MAG: hypothetical protein IPF66_13490 [Holophagales bacterium]|nr:hypothetical protein [Holophagales bacterium]